MKARIQEDNLGPVHEIDDVRSIVVYDDFKRPLLIVQKVEQGTFITTTFKDPKFQQILKGLGVGLNVTEAVTS